MVSYEKRERRYLTIEEQSTYWGVGPKMNSRRDDNWAPAARFRHPHTPYADGGHLTMSCEPRQPVKEQSESINSPKVQQGASLCDGVKSRESMWRQHQIPLERTMTASTSTSMTKSDLGGLGSDISTSDYDRNDHVISNATHFLQRLKLDMPKDSDKSSSKATAKASSFAFQMEGQILSHSISSSTTYYRPEDSLAKDRTDSRPVLHVMVPSGPPATADSSTSRLRSVSSTPTRIQAKLHRYRQKNDMRKISLVKSASESDNSDDDSVKRMESVTHIFQRNLSVTNGNSKVSAIPLSGIGVDVGVSDYNQNGEHHHLNTPRDTSCSLTSFIGEIIGLTTPTKKSGETKSRSPFDIISKVLCSPHHVSTACGAKDDSEWKSVKDDARPADADDWSLEYSVQSESDNDSRNSINSSTQRKAGLGMLTKIDKSLIKPYRPPDMSQCRRYHREDLSICGTDAGSTYYQPSQCYSADAESYADNSYVQSSQYCHGDDDKSYVVSSVSYKRSKRFRKSPFVRRLK